MKNKNEFQWHRMQKFAIRKFSVGAASVMIGSTLVGTLIPSAVHSDSPVLISTQILENESNIKRVLEFFADPATGKISGPNGVRTIDYSYSNVNAKIGELNAEKANATKRVANDYTPEAYTKYQSDLKTAAADLTSVQAMLNKAQEINGKAAAYLSEISSLIDSKRKDLAYNVVTQEEKKAINNRLIQIYNDINYMDQYKQTMVQFYDHLTALKNSTEELTYSPSQAK